MIDGFTQGTLKGLSLIGWGADYPDPSNFLDYHFGSGSGKKFGAPFQDIVDALNQGLAAADPAARTAAYATANTLIKQHVPAVIIAHGASGDAFKADVAGAYASVFGGEVFARMQPADRKTLVFEGNAEPLSLFCADESDGESLRACEQTNESLYRYDGAKSVPALATECKPSADSKTWTCKLRDGVKFHNGAEARRQRCRRQLRAPVGRQEPAAQGPRQPVRLLGGPVGRLPQPGTEGNAGSVDVSTGNVSTVSVTVLRQRFRSDDMAGGAASAAPPTD